MNGKFKVWDKEKKKFVELEGGYYIHSSGALCYFGNAGMGFADKRYKAVLSTGKTDKNGVELFDGDICTGVDGLDRTFIDPIIFDELCWRLGYHKTDLYKWHEKIERIGNKFENPELMESK